MNSKDVKDRKIEALTRALREATDTLGAIRGGEVDAIVVEEGNALQVLTLKGADRSYHLMMESMNEGAVTLSEDGTLLYANKSFSDLVRKPVNQLIGKKFIEQLTLDSAGDFVSFWLSASQGAVGGELRLMQEGGSFVPVQVSINPVVSDGLKYFHVVVNDMTEHKRTRVIIAEEAQLRKKNEDLVKLNQSRSEFTSMVSHELRTPLIAIREGISLVLQGVDGPVTEAQRETLTMTKNNVERLDRLIQNVLSLSSMEAGRIPLKRFDQDLVPVVKDVCKLMNYAAQKKKLTLHTDLPENPVIFSFDADALRQVLTNLIHNAIKFTEVPGTVSVALKTREDTVLISVSDNGIGIRSEDEAKIFGMFERVGPASQKTPGTGIGLAVCKKLVEAHGGMISVDSEIGRGSVFTVILKQ